MACFSSRWWVLMLWWGDTAGRLVLLQQLVHDGFGELLYDIASHSCSDARTVAVLGGSDMMLPCPMLVAQPSGMLSNFTQHVDCVFIVMHSDTFPFSNLPRRWLRAHFVLLIPQHCVLQEVFDQLSTAEITDFVVKTLTYEHASPPYDADLHGCVVKFTILDLAPDVILKHSKYQNLSVHPQDLLGVEMELVSTLAQKMNFTPQYNFPTDGTHWGWQMENGTVSGMVGDVYHRVSDVGVGHVTPNPQVMNLVEYSAALGMDCYGWGIPLGVGHSPAAWMTLTSEFSGITWELLFLILCMSTVVLWALSRPCTPCAVLWFTYSTLIASPVVMRPRCARSRMFIALWLLYCIVVSVAYQAQLGSIVTVPWGPPDIHNMQELVESSLELRAPWNVKLLLDELRHPGKQIRKLLERLKPESRVKEKLEELQHESRDFAYLSNTRSLSYYASQSGWKFNVLTEGCILRHHTALVVRMGYPLLPRMNQLIGRLTQAGLFTKWEYDYTPRSRSTEMSRSGLSLPHLLGVFMMLAVGLFTSLLVFIMEVTCQCLVSDTAQIASQLNVLRRMNKIFNLFERRGSTFSTSVIS